MKMDQLRLFKLGHNLVKISADFQTAFIADMHSAEEQWLNVVKLRMFRVGTRMSTVSRTDGQYLVPLKTFIKKTHRNNDAYYAVSADLIFPIYCHNGFPHLKKIFYGKKLEIFFARA
jgi:hypothetical protein